MTSPLAACSLALDDETLSAWHDQSLNPARMQQIATHVPDCVACRRRLATFARIASDLARRPALAPGNRIVNGVMAQIAAEEHTTMAQPRRSLQRGISALAVVALIAAFAVIFTQVLHGHPAASSTSRVSNTGTSATSTVGTTTLPFTPIVSVAQAWGAHAATVITPHIDSQHYYETGGISADGSLIFGSTVNIVTQTSTGRSAGSTAIPGTYRIATNTFTPYNVPLITNAMGPATGCCQASATFAIISQNTEVGATCGICHTIYYSVDLASGETRLLTDPQFKAEQGFMGMVLSQDHALVPTGSGALRLVDLHTGTFSDLPGPTFGLGDSVVDFAWPYLVYSTSDQMYGANGPSQVTVRDLRTGAETIIHAPAGNNAAFARPFSTNPGTPYPTATPPTAFTGILGGAITGDTFFFMSQTTAATQLYEIDHLMTPGAPARVIATLPNHHDGTQFAVGLANDRLVLVQTSHQNSDYTENGQNLAFDRVQNRFVDLSDYSGSSGYVSISINGHEMLVATLPATGQISNTDTIFDTATLPTR